MVGMQRLDGRGEEKAVRVGHTIIYKSERFHLFTWCQDTCHREAQCVSS